MATDIPETDVIKVSENTQAIKFNFGNMIASTLTITLLNNVPATYDFEYSASLLSEGWYNEPVVITDNETDSIVWRGRIKNVKKTDSGIEIISKNFIKDLIDTDVCQSVGADKITTPAEVILYILTQIVEIPSTTDYIDLASFETARTLQAGNSGYLRILYDLDNTADASSIIQEICRITCSDLYLVKNRIYYKQWQAFTANDVADHSINRIVEGSYKAEHSDKNIFNDYRISYLNSTVVSRAKYSGSSYSSSISKYGERRFKVPEDRIDSSTPEDFRILLTTATGASYYGGLQLQRNSSIKRIAKFSLDWEHIDIQLYDLLSFNYEDYVGEPLRVISRKPDADSSKIEIEAEFLNLDESVTIDTTPPDAIELVSLIPQSDDSLKVYWNPSLVSDLSGYKIYFSDSSTVWEEQYLANVGFSPIDESSPLTDDGLYYYSITGAGTNKRFYKIHAYDTSGNLSEEGNIKESLHVLDAYENQYYLTGTPLSGLSLDVNNPKNGTPPSSEILYGEAVYGLDYYGLTAYYLSPIYRLTDYNLFSYSGSGNINFQYKSSSDNITWSSWSSDIDANETASLDISSYNYFQFRLIFTSDKWSDSDSFQITEIK